MVGLDAAKRVATEQTTVYTEVTMLARLAKMFPSVAEERLSALADVWSIERDTIVNRMLDICREETGPVMASTARPEAIFQLANLTMWLENQIIAKKLERRLIEDVDPNAERYSLELSSASERIENTARICADRIWKPLLDQWHRRFPLLSASGEQRGKFLSSRSAPTVKNQHYCPSFSNEFWAVGAQKLVRIYSLNVGGEIVSKDRGYTAWGREAFLYSQQLERMLQLIESDAKGSYTKLLDLVPLGENEQKRWIAFVLAQTLRTPSFILSILPRLQQYIEAEGIAFPTDLGNLRKAHETLFSNNNLYTEFFRLITARQWSLWRAPSDAQFIRSDNPVVVRGSANDGTWQLIYPMTPETCFVVGPDCVCDLTAVVPQTREIPQNDVRMVNQWMANASRKSVIARPMRDDHALRTLLQEVLAPVALSEDWRRQCFPTFWGPLVTTD